MGRKAKKQKVSESSSVPLGSFLATQSAQVDEDERALEEAVFGRAATHFGIAEDDRDDERQQSGVDEDVTETGLERMGDDALFFVDVPKASTSKVTLESDVSSGDESNGDESASAQPVAAARKTGRRPVWHDPADELVTVSLSGSQGARLKKLRNNAKEDAVGGLEYEARLRRQFEKLHPVPSWAAEARRKVLKKRRRAETGSNDSDASQASDLDEQIDDLFRTTGSRQSQAARGSLRPGEIDIDRLRDANQAAASSSPITALGFHPTAQVLFSATSDRRLRLFQIDGTDNPLLQTLHLPELPIAAASYHPSGSAILLTGNRPFFLSYDLQSGQVLRSPRGLLTSGLGGTDRQSSGGHGGMERAYFSPDGSLLALGGRRGYVHLIDWAPSGSSTGGQVVGEVKMNAAVKGIAWQRDGRELVTLGDDSEVYVWDVGTRRCVNRWKDEGGFAACGIATDSKAKFTAVGSSTGIVNVYDSKQQLPAPGAERKALRTIGNLTTAVTTMRFSPDSQILALASKTAKDQLKLVRANLSVIGHAVWTHADSGCKVHLPSATVFSNWPTKNTPLNHVTDCDFSKGSEFFVIGNTRGKVLLYDLAYSHK